mmetsp:Transcript_12082/g.50845  ORF Transcript_12082/g.50845 Transcript_12082/m.50845 type:complete len:254 (+) Transcript_12082:1166-1927(+)
MVLPELLVVHRADARQRAVRDERDGARGVIHLRDEHLHQRTELHALAHGLEHLLKSRQEDPGVHRDVRHLAHVRVTRADLLRSDHLQRGRELREAIKRGFTPVVRASDVPAAAAAAARALARARAAAAVRAVRVPIRAGGAAETRVALRAHRRLRAEIGRGGRFFLSRHLDGRGGLDVRAEGLVKHVPISQPVPVLFSFFNPLQRAHPVAVRDVGEEFIQPNLVAEVPHVLADAPGVHRGRVFRRAGHDLARC